MAIDANKSKFHIIIIARSFCLFAKDKKLARQPIDNLAPLRSYNIYGLCSY